MTWLDSLVMVPYVVCSVKRVEIPGVRRTPVVTGCRGTDMNGAYLSLPVQGDVSRHSMSLLERERALRHCNINMPDGSCCSVPLRPGVSVREVLLGLCEKLAINLAAVDLFLVGGEKVRPPDISHSLFSSKTSVVEDLTHSSFQLVHTLSSSQISMVDLPHFNLWILHCLLSYLNCSLLYKWFLLCYPDIPLWR